MTPILGIMASGMSGNLWAPGKDYDSIATSTVGGTSVTSVTFSSIPATYKHLQLRVFSDASTPTGFGLRFNNDSNSAWHYLKGDGTNVVSSASTYQAGDIYAGDTGTSSGYGVQIIDLLDYTNTNKFKVMRSLGGYDLNGSGVVSLRSGYWGSTAAITTVSFHSATWLQYSSFALYGVK